MQSPESLRKKIRIWIVVFIISLVLSGVTAFALESELRWAVQLINNKYNVLGKWINSVYTAIHETNLKYPFLSYGYDWLAFAHLVIAVVFIGPLRDPIRNKWVIQFGIIACCMIFPLALIAGNVRQIPFFWQLIDCSFGLIGLIPLCICYNYIKQLEIQIVKFRDS